MNINNFFQFLVPKDKKFFPLFEQASNNLIEIATNLHEAVNLPLKEREVLFQKIDALEQKGEDITRQTNLELSRNFITPFDREDISHLASGLDDIADFMYASAKYIYLYKAPLDPAYTEFTLLIQKCCLEIQNALIHLNDFKDVKSVKESCIKINSFENIADDVLSQGIVKLFESDDAISIIKVKSVLEYLEIVTDKAEDVANIIDSILIKYA